MATRRGASGSSRWRTPASPLDLPCISPISPLDLPYISPRSPLCLPYISLHLRLCQVEDIRRGGGGSSSNNYDLGSGVSFKLSELGVAPSYISPISRPYLAHISPR